MSEKNFNRILFIEMLLGLPWFWSAFDERSPLCWKCLCTVKVEFDIIYEYAYMVYLVISTEHPTHLDLVSKSFKIKLDFKGKNPSTKRL